MKNNGRQSRGRGGSSLPDSGVRRQLADLLRAQWTRHRRRLKRCQEHFSKRAVHDSRVATRRLLATLDLLETLLSQREIRKARRALKQYLDIFDPLRDVQVQLAYAARWTSAHTVARKFADWLQKREVRITRRTRKALKAVRIKRLGRRLAGLEQIVRADRPETSRPDTGQRLLQAVSDAFARTAQLQSLVRTADPLTIHRTRLAFKRFRYMVEALPHLIPGVTRSYRRSLRRYQSLAGDIQDLQVMLASLEDYRRRKKLPNVQVGSLRRELLRRQQRRIRTYLAAAGRLSGFWPPSPTTPSNSRTS